MYKVTSSKINKLDIITLENNNGEKVSISPKYGTNILKLVLKNRSIIDGYKNESQLKKKKGSRNIKLIPFPNRIKDGKYKFRSKVYQLPINKPQENNASHGFIYNKPFKLIKKKTTKNSAQVTLQYIYKEELMGYPFKLDIQITYALDKSGLKTTTKITNNSKKPIPVGDGWHPYFKLNNNINNLELKLPKCKKLATDKRMMPTGKKTLYNNFNNFKRIGSLVLDTGFEIINKGKLAKFEIKNNNRTLTLWQETGKSKYNYFQVYTPKERSSIAIEPMSCATNAFNNKEGLITLQPNKSFKASYGIKLEIN